MAVKAPFITRAKAALQILAGYHLQDWSRDRRYNVRTSQTARKDIPYEVRRRMLDWSRELERKDPIFNRFLDLNEQYVVGPTGLRIVSASRDTIAAQVMNDIWDGWQPNCDIGSRHSFGLLQGLITRELCVAGEVFIFLTFGSTARPRIQLIPSELVETPASLKLDKTILDGVRRDPNGRAISYFVREDSDDPKQTFREIDAERIVHVYDPSRIGQSRGLPIVYPVLKDMLDLTELQDLEMLAAKDAAATSKVVKTGTGELTAEQIVRGTSVTDADGVTDHYKKIVGAETIVLYPGDDYQQFASNRPTVAAQTFWDYVSAREAAGMGLPIEILLMKSMQGTVARGAYSMANAYFRCRSAVLAEKCGFIWVHVQTNDPVSRRLLPPDFRRIRYTPPRSINVDVGRNSNAMIAEWKAGLRTLESIAAENGEDWREIQDQRANEAERALQIEQERKLPPGSIMTLGETKTATPAAEPQRKSEAEPEMEDETEDETETE